MSPEARIYLGAIAHLMRMLPGVGEESVQVVCHYLGICVEQTEAEP